MMNIYIINVACWCRTENIMEFTKDIRMNDGISLGIDIGSTTAKIV